MPTIDCNIYTYRSDKKDFYKGPFVLRSVLPCAAPYNLNKHFIKNQ